jgi:ubiquinone/menaquinone biosynthesis C-methylase UbiE
LGSFYSLPFKEASFNTVASTNAISGVDIDAVAVLREIMRMAREEVRIADYSKPDRQTPWNSILMWLERLIGDQPNDYKALLRAHGYEAYIEKLEHSLYKYIQVTI